MSLPPINTIINTAPMIIQGATGLIKLIRERGRDHNTVEEIPDSIDGIKNEVDRLHNRLDTNDESNVEQIKLIEELAKQNESLAAQLKSTMTQLNRISLLAVIALLISIFCLLFLLQSA